MSTRCFKHSQKEVTISSHTGKVLVEAFDQGLRTAGLEQAGRGDVHSQVTACYHVGRWACLAFHALRKQSTLTASTTNVCHNQQLLIEETFYGVLGVTELYALMCSIFNCLPVHWE